MENWELQVRNMAGCMQMVQRACVLWEGNREFGGVDGDHRKATRGY